MEHAVVFASDIEPRPTTEFIRLVREAVGIGAQKLPIAIASHGGNTRSGICCYNVLRMLPLSVTTYNLSNVDSAAVPLFLAGEERLMSPRGSILLHRGRRQFRSGVHPDESELRDALKLLRIDTRTTVDLIAERTGLSTRRVAGMIRDSEVLDSDRALKLGFATQISDCKLPTGIQVSSVHV